jgi:lipopolysaccharide export system protein LptC
LINRTANDNARVRAVAAARRHTRLVKVLRIVAPIVGGLIVVAVVAAVAAVSFLPEVKVSSALLSKDGLTMVEPRVSGFSNNRAYHLTAERAFQSIKATKVIQFENVDARIEMEKPNWARITSKRGVYNSDKETVKLEKSVKITTTEGQEIITERADADIKSGLIMTEAPVTITGARFRVESVGAEVKDNGKVIIFKSKVRMTIVPESSNVAAAPVAPVVSTSTATPAQELKGAKP